MIRCEDIQTEDMIDRYILHQLSPEDEEFFEEHCFSCDRCFWELQQTQKLIHILKEGYKRKKRRIAEKSLSV